MQELDFLRIHRETQKFMEIDNIFNRLSQPYISRIYVLFKDIFQCEHDYTIQELLKLAIQKEIPLKEFKLAEHYKLNSHIFKSNLIQIVNVVIEDIWVQYNKQILVDEKKFMEPRLLTQIDEESNIDLQQSDLQSESATERFRQSQQSDYAEQCDRINVNVGQMNITPRLNKSNNQQKNIKTIKEEEEPHNQISVKSDIKSQSSSRMPLARLLSSTDRVNPQSLINSPRHSKENSGISLVQTQQSITNSKKKNSSIIKNKSMDLKQFAEGLMKNTPKSPQVSVSNLHNLMQKMQFCKDNNLTK